MATPLKLQDDCSNCGNHVQGSFNKAPCKACLDDAMAYGGSQYLFWVPKSYAKPAPEKTPMEKAVDTVLRFGEEPMPSLYISTSARDAINPDHYKIGGIETIDFIKAKLSPEEFIGYLRGSALKYLSRLGNKDAAKQEASKAEWFINRLKDEL